MNLGSMTKGIITGSIAVIFIAGATWLAVGNRPRADSDGRATTPHISCPPLNPASLRATFAPSPTNTPTSTPSTTPSPTPSPSTSPSPSPSPTVSPSPTPNGYLCGTVTNFVNSPSFQVGGSRGISVTAEEVTTRVRATAQTNYWGEWIMSVPYYEPDGTTVTSYRLWSGPNDYYAKSATVQSWVNPVGFITVPAAPMTKYLEISLADDSRSKVGDKRFIKGVTFQAASLADYQQSSSGETGPYDHTKIIDNTTVCPIGPLPTATYDKDVDFAHAQSLPRNPAGWKNVTVQPPTDGTINQVSDSMCDAPWEFVINRGYMTDLRFDLTQSTAALIGMDQYGKELSRQSLALRETSEGAILGQFALTGQGDSEITNRDTSNHYYRLELKLHPMLSEVTFSLYGDNATSPPDGQLRLGWETRNSELFRKDDAPIEDGKPVTVYIPMRRNADATYGFYSSNRLYKVGPSGKQWSLSHLLLDGKEYDAEPNNDDEAKGYLTYKKDEAASSKAGVFILYRSRNLTFKVKKENSAPASGAEVKIVTQDIQSTLQVQLGTTNSQGETPPALVKVTAHYTAKARKKIQNKWHCGSVDFTVTETTPVSPKIIPLSRQGQACNDW